MSMSFFNCTSLVRLSAPIAVVMAMFLSFSSPGAPKIPGASEGAAKDDGAKAEEASAEASTNDVGEAESKAETNEDAGFARYRTIMDRMPFGPEPVGFDPESPGRGGGGAGGAGGELTPEQLSAQQSEEAQRIIAAVRVSVLNVTPSGKIAVGFTDNSRQPPSNYYLKVGESRDGWSVKAADAAEQSVTLSKDGVDAELKLGEGSDGKSGGKGAAAKAGAAKPGGRGRFLPRGGLPGHAIAEAAPDGGAEEKAEPPPTGGNAIAQLRERARLKRAAAKAEEDERARQVAEERRQREQQQRQAAEEREQQREALLQIQEELRRQREQREQQREAQAGEEQAGDGGNE